MKKYAKLWLIPLGLTLLSLGALKLSRTCWNSLVAFEAPRFTMKPGGKADPVGRVVLVIVDGVRIDAFEKMTYVSSLKEGGASFILKTGQPSLTEPACAVMVTGAWQDVTGVTTNFFQGTLGRDSLFSLAGEGGLTTAYLGSPREGRLLGDVATMTYARKWENSYGTLDEDMLRQALEFLSEDPSFCLVYFVDTDVAGHDFGALSPQCRKAADHIDGLIEKLHRSLSKDTVLIVTSDHGHIARGGHGGWEAEVTSVPLLLYGRGVKPGNYGLAQQTDIAPTVAALLGLPVPPYSQGRILTEALELGGKEARLRRLQAEHKEAFARAYLNAIGEDVERVRREIGPVPQEDDGRYWDGVLAKGVAEKKAAERVRRIPLTLIVLVAALLSVGYIKKRLGLSLGRPLALSLFYFAAFYGMFFASGKRISLSTVNHDFILAFFNETMLYAGLAAILMGIGVAFLNRKAARYETAKASVLATALAAFLLIVQLDAFFLYNGPVINWYIPNMLPVLKYYLDLLSLVILGFISSVIPFIALGAHRVITGSFKHQ